jgi:hypothetical protein
MGTVGRAPEYSKRNVHGSQTLFEAKDEKMLFPIICKRSENAVDTKTPRHEAPQSPSWYFVTYCLSHHYQPCGGGPAVFVVSASRL